MNISVTIITINNNFLMLNCPSNFYPVLGTGQCVVRNWLFKIFWVFSDTVKHLLYLTLIFLSFFIVYLGAQILEGGKRSVVSRSTGRSSTVAHSTTPSNLPWVTAWIYITFAINDQNSVPFVVWNTFDSIDQP